MSVSVEMRRPMQLMPLAMSTERWGQRAALPAVAISRWNWLQEDNTAPRGQSAFFSR